MAMYIFKYVIHKVRQEQAWKEVRSEDYYYYL